MRGKKMFYGLIVLTLTIVGCERSTVEEDMASYCECVKTKGTSTHRECVEQADRMIQKYEFDSEASEYIQESIGNCLVN